MVEALAESFEMQAALVAMRESMVRANAAMAEVERLAAAFPRAPQHPKAKAANDLESALGSLPYPTPAWLAPHVAKIVTARDRAGWSAFRDGLRHFMRVPTSRARLRSSAALVERAAGVLGDDDLVGVAAALQLAAATPSGAW
jgi:hypothetical protein